jgi:dihydrofolate reductase
MPGALPGRRSIVVSRNPDLVADGAEVAPTVDEAFDRAGAGPVFVVGGGEIYAQTIDRADALELTEVAADLDGDVFFPELDRTTWAEVAREPQEGYAFVRYERR